MCVRGGRCVCVGVGVTGEVLLSVSYITRTASMRIEGPAINGERGDYNKEYHEGFLRECVLSAAVSESLNPKGEVIHSRLR